MLPYWRTQLLDIKGVIEDKKNSGRLLDMPKIKTEHYTPDKLDQAAADLIRKAEEVKALAQQMRDRQIGGMDIKNSVGMRDAPIRIGKFITAGLQQLITEEKATTETQLATSPDAYLSPSRRTARKGKKTDA